MKRKQFYKADRIRDIKELLKRAENLYSDRIVFKELGPHKEVHEYTYSRMVEDVNALGTKLLKMGLKGKHIALLGENSYSWVISYLAVVNGVGVSIPLDKELMEDDIAKLLIRGDADVIICSEQFGPEMKGIIERCPKLETCIVMNTSRDYPDFHVLEELIAEGRKLLQEGNRNYLDRMIDEDCMCEIVFTSGTTGANKGVMLSHRNIMSVIYGAMNVIKADRVSFSVLPINHTYECSCHILGGIYSGITICFNDSLKRVVENIKRFKPNMTLMVPLFIESIYKSIWKESEKQGLDGHLRYGIWFSNLLRKFGIDKRRYFFKPILEKFGGNLDQIVCGGAPLRQEVAKGLSDLGIDVLNGFGITECAPLVACNMRSWNKHGSVGRIMPNCRVRIDKPNESGIGEIQVNGDNVMLGYYKDPESTKVAFTEDGWFRTGDLGYIDRDEFLYINGREKNLIILSNGKNVYPEEIEDVIIRKMPYVKEVVVYAKPKIVGDDSINACIYFDEEFLLDHGILSCREKLNLDMKMVNRSLPGYKRVSNVLISEIEFVKTTTKKIKRDLILEGSYQNA
ncbi:MAG TPA: AMP-binding protein [Tissierellaceae bacterium]|nr:AMP-binding protein [Tissierellaceae bacterium]